MKHAKYLLLCLSATSLIAQDEAPISPAVVESQLSKAEQDFNKAKKMFNPWYTGPLLAPSSSILPPGYFNIQPYLFVTDNYAHFDEHGKSHSIPDLISLNGTVVVQYGFAKRVQASFAPQIIRNSQSGHCSVSFGDTPVGIQFGLFTEKPYKPGVVFAVQESFPSGVYEHLNPKKGGVDATGAGTYGTKLSLVIGKVVWWWFPSHPMRFRLATSFQMNSDVDVDDFNAYGGGFGTDGTVHPGSNFSMDFGYEYSFTQRWVFALDVVYAYNCRTTFSGDPGLDGTGAVASVGGPFNDQLSFAPAIEYNVNENFGYIAGVWFSAWGRNSLNFVSGVFSFTYTF